MRVVLRVDGGWCGDGFAREARLEGGLRGGAGRWDDARELGICGCEITLRTGAAVMAGLFANAY